MAPRLRVLAGTSPDAMVPITHIVNTGTAHRVSSSLFEGEIAAYIKGFPSNERSGVAQSRGEESEYFRRGDRTGVTWSIQVKGVSLERLFFFLWKSVIGIAYFPLLVFLQPVLSMTVANYFSLGRFLVPHSADDILFGNTFDRPLKLPWGTGAVLKFMKSISFIFSRSFKIS